MKIAEVRTHCLSHILAAPFESASARFTRREHCLVEVTCEDGTVGWGECLGPSAVNAAMVAAYAPLLVGKDPLETECRWLELFHAFRDAGPVGLTVSALSGIDIALWDIKGKHFGASVSTLLGGRFRNHIQAYATGGFSPVGDDRIEVVAAEAAGYVREGFDALKIKIGFGKQEDLKVIAAVRDVIGAERLLMVDANHGYGEAEAIALGREAERFNIEWLEEPVLPEQLGVYARLRMRQPLPIAGGETWHGSHALRQALDAHAVDILQPDVCGCGGFSEMKRVFDMASHAGVRVVPHVWGGGIALAAGLQCLAALAPDPLRPLPLAPLLEFDRTPNPCRQAVLVEPLEHRDGIVQIPEGPGLGITIDRDALVKYQG